MRSKLPTVSWSEPRALTKAEATGGCSQPFFMQTGSYMSYVQVQVRQISARTPNVAIILLQISTTFKNTHENKSLLGQEQGNFERYIAIQSIGLPLPVDRRPRAVAATECLFDEPLEDADYGEVVVEGSFRRVASRP